MGKIIKGIVGLSFAAYCAVSAVWLGKNMNYMDKLNHAFDDDDKDEQEDKKKVRHIRKDKPPKYFTVVPKRDDDSE